jgi:hypothetical protein
MKFRVKEEYITGVVQASYAKSREEKIYEAPARQSTFSVSNTPAESPSNGYKWQRYVVPLSLYLPPATHMP